MKAFLTFVVAFLLSYAATSQSISIQPIPTPLCNSQDTYIQFTTEGEFDDDDEFILYFLRFSGTTTIAGRSDGDSVLIKPTFSTSIFIESSISKISSDTIQVNVDPFTGPFMRYSNDPVCEGFSNTLEIYTGLVPGDNIIWLRDGQKLSANQPIYNAFESGYYEAKIERGSCIYEVGGKADIEVGRIEKATLSSQHSPEVCDGFTVEIQSDLPDIETLTYQWLFDGDTIPGASSPTYSASESGIYQLVLQQGICSSYSDGFAVKVGNLKSGKILSQPIPAQNGVLTVCEGINANLALGDYQGRNDIELTWLKNGIAIDSGIFNKSLFTKQPASYRYRLKQGDCEVLSEAVELRNGSMKGFDLFSLSGTSACEGRTANLLIGSKNNIVANNSFNLSLQKDGEFRGDVPFLFDFLRISSSGNYHIEGNFGNEDCLIYSDTLSVDVSDEVVKFDIYRGIDNIQSCSDSTLIGNNLSLTGINGSNVKFNWEFEGSPLFNNNEKGIYATQNGNYVLHIEVDSSCSYESNPLNVSLNTFQADIISEEALCADNVSYLSVKIGGERTRIQKESGTPLFNADLSYEWFSGNDLLGTGEKQAISKSGIYRSVVKFESCESESSMFPVQLIEINKTLRPLTDTLGLCPDGGMVGITASGIADTYQWINDNLSLNNNDFEMVASEVGSYKVWMEKDGCGAMSNTMTVAESDEKPTARIFGGGTIELNNSVDLEIVLGGSAPWTFTTTDGQTITTNFSPYILTVSPLENTVYSITTVSNPCGFGETFGGASVNVLVLGNEEKFGNEIIVYPNPAQHALRVKGHKIDNEIIDYQIISMGGIILKEGQLSTVENEIDIRELQPETYLIKIKSKGKISTFKIFKYD